MHFPKDFQKTADQQIESGRLRVQVEHALEQSCAQQFRVDELYVELQGAGVKCNARRIVGEAREDERHEDPNTV